MNTTKHGLLAAAVLLSMGLAVSAGIRPAMAQDAPTPDKKISLTVTQAPIQSVLKTLFGSEGVNYTIDQDVQGSVTVDINEVTFDTALHALLKSTNPPLTYSIESGIYHVKVKPQDVGPGTTGTTTTATTDTGDSADYNLYKIPIDRYDAVVIAKLLSMSKSPIIPVGPNYTLSGGGGSTNGSSGISGGATNGLGGSSGGFGSTTGGIGGSSGGFGGTTGGFGGTTGGFGGTTGGFGGTSGTIGGTTF